MFQVFGLTETTKTILLDAKVLSNNMENLIVRDPNDIISDYIGALDNFMFGTEQQDHDNILHIIKDTMHGNSALQTFLLINHDALDPNIPAINAPNTIIDSIKVEPLYIAAKGGATGQNIWRIYGMPPSFQLDVNRQYQQQVLSMSFMSNNGVGSLGVTLQMSLFCHGCKLNNHPSGLCPFLQILGWFSVPTPPPTQPPMMPVVGLSRSHLYVRTRGHRQGHGHQGGAQGTWF